MRRNAETSQTESTKQAARKFGEELPKNISSIQRRLRKGYRFAKAHGATPPKGKGKSGKRPLVIAPLPDRIVQRSILDVLQDAKELKGVQRVLSTPTSVGGIKGRGVRHAIELFDDRQAAGDRYVAGSDISGFFTKIRPQAVLDLLRQDRAEAEFVDLTDRALTVELANAPSLSEEDRKLFPMDGDGVAQGCPLSALAGNIVLEKFDQKMNDRGITCIRYIDDFIVTGRTLPAVQKAMEAAKAHLANLGMSIYDPITDPNKAFIGKIGEAHVFLGYELVPDRYPPSKAACEKFEARINQAIKHGQGSIRKAVTHRPLTSQDRCYAQTLVAIDNIVRGWRGSFQCSTAEDVFDELDAFVDRRLKDFAAFYQQTIAKRGRAQRRLALGVRLLATLE